MTGTFTVTLIVEDEKGAASDPATKDVTVTSVNTAGPVAVLTGDMQGQPAMQLTFKGDMSTPVGDIQNFEWDFGDSTAKVIGKDKTIVQHAFAAAGSYTVKLTVTDSLAAAATATMPVAIGAVGPLAVCNGTPLNPTVGMPVMFTGMNSTVPAGAMIVSYLWDFGDGQMNIPGMMPGGTASHAYTMQGTFTPRLTVTDNAMPRRTHTATCPQVTVGAASLCNGMYTWMATGGSALCQFVATTVEVVQNANGTITVTEPSPSGPIIYTGTWSGNTFDTTDSDSNFDYRLRGTFSGCGSWTGIYDTLVGTTVLCTATTSASRI
jgi:PKD repeat protein